MASFQLSNSESDNLTDTDECPAQVRGDLPFLRTNQFNFTRKEHQLSQDEAGPSTLSSGSQLNCRYVQQGIGQGFSQEEGQGTVEDFNFGTTGGQSNDGRVYSSDSFSTLLWNLDGIKSVTRKTRIQNHFEGADIVQLVETNSVKAADYVNENTGVTGYDVFWCTATKPVKNEREIGGRGIAVYAKTHCCAQQKFDVRNQHTCICIDTKFGRVYTYYFRPNFNIYELIRQLVEDLLLVKGRIIVSADPNCAMRDDYGDAKNIRGKFLFETMSFLGFHLLSKPSERTFSMQHPGEDQARSSCIDLVFVKGWDEYSLPTPVAIPVGSKKHRKILTNWSCSSSASNQISNRKASLSMSGGRKEGSQPAMKRLRIESESNNSGVDYNEDYEEILKQIFEIVSKERGDHTKRSKSKRPKERNRPLMYYTVTNTHQVVRHISELKLPLVMPPIPADVLGPEQSSAGQALVSLDSLCKKPILENEVIQCSELLREARKSRVSPTRARSITSLIAQKWANDFSTMLERGKLSTSLRKTVLKTSSYELFVFQEFTNIINTRLMRILPNIEEEHKYSHGKSEETALKVFLEQVSPVIVEGSGSALFAVFVNLKTFERLDRGILCDKLIKLGVKNDLYRLLKSLVHDLDSTSQRANQKGLPTVITNCGALVLAYLSDLPAAIFSESCSCVLYGGDLTMYTKLKNELQPMINRLKDWCDLQKMELKASDLKVMTFCRQRRKKYELEVSPKLNEEKLAQPSRIFFFGFVFKPTLYLDDQIASCLVKCTQIIGTLKQKDDYQHIYTVDEALEVYREHILKICAYGLDYMKPNLNVKMLKALDNIKARFLKVALGFPETLSNALVFHFADRKTMGEDLEKYVEHAEYAKYRRHKTNSETNIVYKSGVDEGFYSSDSFRRYLKMNPSLKDMCKWWGFHKHLCETENCQKIQDTCKCKNCGKSACNRHHILTCGHHKAKEFRKTINANEKESVVNQVVCAAEITENEFLNCHKDLVP